MMPEVCAFAHIESSVKRRLFQLGAFATSAGKLIRRTMGRDARHTRKFINRLGYQATMRRIEREGV